MIKANFFYIIGSLIIFAGCKDFIEVGPPSSQIVASGVFANEETATAAINGIYATMSNTNLISTAGGQSVYLGLYADELSYTSNTANIVEFFNGRVAEANTIVYSNFWRYNYQVIYQTNSCIEGIQASVLPSLVKNQLLGEAYFLRAYTYWQLTSLFGDLPLILTAKDYYSAAQMSRSPSTKVQTQILEDLGLAKSLLKNTYPSNGRYRANYYVVMAFLSRVNTYLAKWNDVISSSNEVISQTGMYGLELDLNKTFLIGSTEAIWQTATGNPSYNTFEGFAFIPATFATTRPTFPLQSSLYTSFISTDKRRSAWIATKTVSGTTYPYPFKYKILQSSLKTEAQMMIRLSEVILNRAEAKARTNDPTAIDDLNKIRNKAGLSSLNGISGQQLVDEIIQERRLELFAEGGLRFYDLKRNGLLDFVLGPIKTQWVSTNKLFPIPAAEILAAPNLSQNQGYN